MINIQELTNKIIAPFLFENKDGITVLLPGGYKPPHGGHLFIANYYASLPSVKEVIILVGPSSRQGFSQKDSIRIWKMMPTLSNVKIKASEYPSPILTAYKYIINQPMDCKDKFTLGAGVKEDTIGRVETFIQNIEKYKKYGTVDGKKIAPGISTTIIKAPPTIVYEKRGIESGQPISARVLRNDVMNKDFKKFMTNYPNVEINIVKKIYDILLKSSKNILLKEERRGAIKHLEDLSAEELLNFLSLWNKDNSGFEITEKVDGKDMEIGVDADGFYTSSRNRKSRSVSEYPDIFMFDDFKYFHSELEKIDILKIVSEILQTNVSTVAIKGEGIASYDSTVTLYNPEKIGSGVFVIIRTTIDNGEELDREQNEALAESLSKQTKIHIVATPKIDAKNIKFKYVDKLDNIIKNYSNILSSRATKDTKELKNEILNKIKQIALKNKESILKALKDYKSRFGDDIEGIVFKMPGGEIVKVVDKDKFLTKKNENWHYLSIIHTLEMNYNRSVKKTPASIKKITDDFQKELTKLKNDYDKNADLYIKIPKKKYETEQYFKIVQTRLDKIKELLKNKPDEDVSKLIMQKLITEGGGTFGHLPQMLVEYRDSTIEYLLNKLNMSSLSYRLIGNYMKPEMNDIDIAVDVDTVAKLIGINKKKFTKEEFFNKLREHVVSLGLKEYKRGSSTSAQDLTIVWIINKGLSQISFKTPVVDKDNSFSGDSVQVDFMVGNSKWMEVVMGPAPGTRPELKAGHRNFLIVAAFSKIILPTKDPEIKQKYQLDMKNGLELVRYMIQPDGKRVKLSVKLIEDNPEEMLKYLFNGPVSYKEVDTFEKLYDKFMGSTFKYPELREDILREFVKTVHAMKLKIPSEVAKYDV